MLQEGKPQAEHTGLLLLGVNQHTPFRVIARELPQAYEPLGMLMDVSTALSVASGSQPDGWIGRWFF